MKSPKKLGLLFLLILSLNNLSNGATSNGYHLKFKITGLRDSLCYLANYYGDKQYLKDSAKADEAGNVVFKNQERLPGGIYLFVFPNKTYFEILIDKEQDFSMECTKDETVETMKVKGSNENEEFYAYLKFISEKSKSIQPLRTQRDQMIADKRPTDELDVQMKAIDKSVVDYKNAVIAKNTNSFLSKILKASQDISIPEAPTLANGKKDSTFAYLYYKAHYFDNLDLADDRLLRTPMYHNKVESYLKNMIMQIPDSIIPEVDMLITKAKPNQETFKYMIWFTTNNYETSNIMGMDAVFVHLVKTYYNKATTPWVDDATLYKIQERARILEPILIGKKVKNLILTDSLDKYQALYNINKPFTILYFWDPDCGHCKKTTPLVKAYYDKVKSKGVEVYAVCTEVEMEKWRKYIKENDLTWINVADPKVQNNFRQEFDILTTPQIFILDKDKKVIAKKIDEVTLEKILDSELERVSKK
jgi:thiol-disulfide isomerase/thioredoxin